MKLIISQAVYFDDQPKFPHRWTKEIDNPVVYPQNGDKIEDSIWKDPYEYEVVEVIIDYSEDEYYVKQIQRLMAYGKKINEIQNEIGLKKSSINSYLPYTKVPYKESEVSANADRCDLYRKRKAAVEKLQTGCLEELWVCIVLFEGYNFKTVTGLSFTYTVHGNELFLSRKEKSVTKASVEKAYKKAVAEGYGVYNRPKDLGDLFGVSYIYPIFYRFGLIDVPEKVKGKMAYNKKIL